MQGQNRPQGTHQALLHKGNGASYEWADSLRVSGRTFGSAKWEPYHRTGLRDKGRPGAE
jgi:hypothetical protein